MDLVAEKQADLEAQKAATPSCPGTPCMVEFTRTRGGAREADWARLLSECWGLNSAVGSNPTLPARNQKGCFEHTLKASFLDNLQEQVNLILLPT